MRPAAVVAWVLFVALLVACPQIVAVALTVAAWPLGQPVALAVALAAALLWCKVRPAPPSPWRLA
jgi:hypothetical protein